MSHGGGTFILAGTVSFIAMTVEKRTPMPPPRRHRRPAASRRTGLATVVAGFAVDAGLVNFGDR